MAGSSLDSLDRLLCCFRWCQWWKGRRLRFPPPCLWFWVNQAGAQSGSAAPGLCKSEAGHLQCRAEQPAGAGLVGLRTWLIGCARCKDVEVRRLRMTEQGRTGSTEVGREVAAKRVATGLRASWLLRDKCVDGRKEGEDEHWVMEASLLSTGCVANASSPSAQTVRQTNLHRLADSAALVIP